MYFWLSYMLASPRCNRIFLAVKKRPIFRRGPPPPQNVAPVGVPSAPAPSVVADDESTQAEMLLRVINLTDAQVALLPPDDRAKVLELRNQLRQHVTANTT